MKKQEDQVPTSAIVFLILLSVFAVILFILFLMGIKHTCDLKAKFNEDIYCVYVYTSTSNVSSSYDNSKMVVQRSHEADRLYEIERQKELKKEKEKQRKIQECYDAGSFVNETFTIKDYDLNCRRIDYLNDHLMDNFEKKDAGYISTSYRGFFSGRSTKAEIYQYVNDRILATGQLIENVNYHLDCEEKKHNVQIDYFTEEEFVMYYVQECIQ